MEDAKVIENVDEVIEKVINGFYVYKVETESSNPQIEKLRNSINSMIEKTNQNLLGLNNILIDYGSSNFSLNDSKIDTSKVGGIVSSLVASTQLIGASVSVTILRLASIINPLMFFLIKFEEPPFIITVPFFFSIFIYLV